jgi:hypothetical protein
VRDNLRKIDRAAARACAVAFAIISASCVAAFAGCCRLLVEVTTDRFDSDRFETERFDIERVET